MLEKRRDIYLVGGVLGFLLGGSGLLGGGLLDNGGRGGGGSSGSGGVGHCV